MCVQAILNSQGCSRDLEHACEMSASTTLKSRVGKDIFFEHHGFHNHPKPHEVRPDVMSKRKAIKIFHIAQEVGPKQLVIGNDSGPSIGKIHHKLNNLSVVTRIRSASFKTKTGRGTLGDLAKLQVDHEDNFIKSISFAQGLAHISIQTSAIAKYTSDLSTPMQSDSVHGFVVDSNFTDVNTTFTSCWSPPIQWNLPLLISIIFGKTTEHYKCHFLALLQSLPFSTWAEFDAGFPGMTCDFSDAERNGFEAAIRSHYGITDSPMDVLDSHYHFCEVHFKCALTKNA